MVQTVEDQLRLLLEKVDRILSLLEAGAVKARRPTSEKKAKAPPLHAEEIAHHQEHFERLYLNWDNSNESEVEKTLDGTSAEELRRFADANNLNVTSKTPKQKTLKLIAGRFRERRQLLKPHFKQRSPLD